MFIFIDFQPIGLLLHFRFNFFYNLKHLLFRFLLLCLLVSFPILSAYGIGRNLGMQAVLYYSFLCTLFIPYIFVNNILFRKIYWLLLCLFTLAWSLTEMGHYLQEHAPFNDLALKILYESYLQELIEYTRTTIPLWLIIIAIICICIAIVFIYKTKHKVYEFTNKQNWILAIVFFLGASYYLFFANAIGDKAGFLKDEYIGNETLNKYYKNIVMDSITIAQKIAPYQFVKVNNGTKNTYVFIIGESTSRHHFGNYGYCRNTTPLLSKRNDINTFSDVISSNTSTVECLSRCLTMKNETENVHDFSCPNIIDIANACNMKTYWLSNQAKEGILYNSITMATDRASVKYFSMDDNEVKNTEKYDEVLLPQLQKALADSAQNKLIILHLMGTHFQYRNRYPKAFQKFETTAEWKQQFPYANSESKLQTINEYDNAVLYNDYLLDSIFTMLATVQNAQAIYISDHAEEVFDYRNFLGHTPQGGNPWLHDVPMITWHVADSLLTNKNKPYQLNRMFYTLCSWMNIDGKNLPWQESIFRKEYVEKKRTLCNGKEYQKIMMNNK
jgi:heptose-I-phosphate ethanolaminephosphotransferase